MATKKNIKINCAFCASKKDSLFSDLNKDDLESLDIHKSCIMYKKGQTLYYEGTRPMGLFCLNSGKVKVYKITRQGEAVLRNALKGITSRRKIMDELADYYDKHFGDHGSNNQKEVKS